MTGFAIISVFTGAGLGALLRWVLGLGLNPLFPTLPLGTLAANLLGGLPIEVGFLVSAEEADRFLDHIGAEGLSLFYLRVPVEFGVTEGGVTEGDVTEGAMK